MRFNKTRKKYLAFSPPLIEDEGTGEVIDTLKSGWITTGPKTQKFEQEFAEYVGARYAIALNSCTAGLFLSLLVGGIKRGDEVITSPYTYAATVNIILHLGAKPVFSDVEKETFNIDPNQIESKITKKTKAIIPVHFAGRPCNMDAINEIAKRHGLLVVEDAAHAVGAKYKKKMVGVLSDFTCFSFQAVKNLTTAEGGMVTTNNQKWAQKLKILSEDGVKKHVSSARSWFYQVVEPGFRFNMTDIMASLGLWQLRNLERNYKRRLKYYKIYNAGFEKIHAITIPDYKIDGRHALHIYPILLNDKYLKISRDQFIKALEKENISSNVHYIPVHFHSFYKKTLKYKRGDFPNAEYLFDHEVTLPLNLVMEEGDVKDVVSSVKKIIDKYKK